MDPNILLANLLFSETKDIEDAKNIVSVVQNRLKRPERFGETLDEVVYAPYQFSGVNSPEWKKAESGNLTEEEAKIYKQMIALASQFNRGQWQDTTKGADHYVNPKLAQPKWAKKYIKTAENKYHTYYQEPLAPPKEAR